MRVGTDTDWTDLEAGDNVMFALKSDGTLWAWGKAASLYTGVSGAEAAMTQIGKDRDWSKLSCYARDLVLTKNDGSLWSMSSRDYGKPAELKRIDLPKDIVAIGGGGGLGAAMTHDGEVWTWGRTIGEGVATFQGTGKNTRQIEAKFHVFDQPWQLSNEEKGP